MFVEEVFSYRRCLSYPNIPVAKEEVPVVCVKENFFVLEDCVYLNILFKLDRYRVETCYSVIKELIVIAGISPIEKDHVSHFISSPHTCSFTLTQDHHGNQPVVADNLSDFQQSLADRGWLPGGREGRGGGRGAQAKGLDADLPVSETATSSHVGMTTSDQWSHISISGSQLPAEVKVQPFQHNIIM